MDSCWPPSSSPPAITLSVPTSSGPGGDTALFAAQGLFNTALFIGLNVLFLAVFQWGIRGYVLSTTVANLVTTLGLVWKARLWRYVQFAPKSRLRRQMLRY